MGEEGGREGQICGSDSRVSCGGGDYSRFRLLRGIEKRSWCFVNALQRRRLMSVSACLLLPSLPCR